MTPKLSSLSHYNWQSEEFEYFFFTDTGNRISVLFFDCTNQFSDCLSGTTLYSLSIENLWLNPSRRANESDNKTRNTIFLILHEFFIKTNGVVLFMVFDSSDRREMARERLFYKSWYSEFGKDICDMEALPQMVVDSVNVVAYVMFPKKSGNKDAVLRMMTAYIRESFLI